MSENDRDLLLDGVEVLDFTHAVAGPFSTRILTDLGASVIKVEAPGGDLGRTITKLPGTNFSAMFQHGSAGKRSICVDLAHPEGVEVVKRLVAGVDVVVDNFAPGVMDRLGLGYEVVKELNPRAIMCSISSFGQYGSHSSYVGADPVGQAMSGFAYMIGEPNGPPYIATSGIADTATGSHAAVAILAALFNRERTGAGRYIDIAMVDVMLCMDCVNLPLAAASRGGAAMLRSGAHNPAVSPFGVFKAAEGYILIEAWGEGPTSLWGRLCKAMGRPELIESEQFKTIDARIENRAALTEAIEAWLQSFADDASAMEKLYEARVVAGPVLSPWEALTQPVAKERDMVREIHHPDVGDVLAIATPYKISGAAVRVGRSPLLGEHGTEILKSRLGMDDDDIAALAQRGVLPCDGGGAALQREGH